MRLTTAIIWSRDMNGKADDNERLYLTAMPQISNEG